LLVPKVDKLIGVEVFATKSSGIGGRIKQFVEDFSVEEILVDGSKATTLPKKSQVLGSSQSRNLYLICVLVKRGWDNFQAIRMISQQLGIRAQQIQIAGIKDAKAITAQYVTIENVTMGEIQKVKVKDVELYPVGYLRNKLSSYYLLGNYFKITIRNIRHSKTAIKERTAKIVEELKEIGGFPNFFGHQRFGTTRPITHFVGKALIQGNFKKAAMLFLAKPSVHEHPDSMQARKQLQTTQDFKEALKVFPKQLRYERLMLMHLSKKPDDYIGAFRRLPIKLRRLFPQAYQAYLFNKFLSKRIEHKIPLNKADVGDYAVNVERTGLPMLTMHRIASAETLAEINSAIKVGKMRLAIPLIGFKQQFSEGAQGEIEKQVLEEEGVGFGDFKIRNMQEISSRGELRTVVSPLSKFALNEILKDSCKPAQHRTTMAFMLYRGSYATVVLREMMKPRNPMKAGF